MTVTQPSAAPARRPEQEADQPLGALVADLKEDLGRLVAEQTTLAKLELKQEGRKAGIGGGLLGAAGFAGYMVAMVGSLAAVYGLGHLVGNGWAALIVTGAWALIAMLCALLGRSVLKRIVGPRQTIAAVKENLAWVRSLKK